MKLYAICLVKNEDDIIEQTLTYATRYCDRIFVQDNGSTDRTWEIVQELAKQYPQIVPFEQTHLPYSNALRARVYNQVYQELSDDDWWMILDSDEFLAEDPKVLIAQARRDNADIIRSWQIQFYFTEKDLSAWEAGLDDRSRSIFERRRYYSINWQEPRLFRNRPTMSWDTGANDTVPNGLARVLARRILNRHYQFRDPEQIKKRLLLRYGHPTSFQHVTSPDWRSALRDSRTLEELRDGEPWRFTLVGKGYYYGKTIRNALRAKYRGVQGRLRHLLRASVT